jgi:hypothetical protein
MITPPHPTPMAMNSSWSLYVMEILYMNVTNYQEAGTAFPSRAPEFTPVYNAVCLTRYFVYVHIL